MPTVGEWLSLGTKVEAAWRLVLSTITARRRSISLYVGPTAEMMHKISDGLRDKYFELLLKEEDLERGKLGPEYLRTELETVGQMVVDHLEDILKTLTKQLVNVCIKLVDHPRQPLPSTPEEWDSTFVYTLCRSRRTKRERFPKDRTKDGKNPTLVSVGKNTDFLLLMKNERKAAFAVPDLKRFNDDLIKTGHPEGYINTTPNWSSDYVTTIVAPIRIQGWLVGVPDVEYDFLGFLCADSLSEKAFLEPEIDHYAQLMLCVADSLYHYFDKVTSLREKLPGV
jgi:hypothetical protein